MNYNFLILSLLFMLPGILIFIIRRDLRDEIMIMSLCSLPFAFTERLFYPTYWEPEFLFDLVNVIGFGIEDLIFVIGLSAFTSTAYAFFTGKTYAPIDKSVEISLITISKRFFLVMGTTFLCVAAFFVLRIEMIYASFFIMLCISGVISVFRKDLFIPSLIGGLLSVFVYSLLCIAFGLLIPDVFKMVWHTDKFLNLFIFGIPIEEYMYGFASGVAATVFYPYVFNKRFVGLKILL